VCGVVSKKKGSPVELVDIVVPDPGPGEVLVDVTACAVCHTDQTYGAGGITDEFPFLLGHEATGVVEVVGEGVTRVAPGDFVILNWRRACGQCRACKRGRQELCSTTFNTAQKMTLTDGTRLTPALGIGAFADKALVQEGQCTSIDSAADPAVAALLGGDAMTGIGAAINTGAVVADDTVAVIGCGGVGDAAIAGAALAGATKIIAVDPVKAIRDLTDGYGADVVIDSVGRPDTWKQAFHARGMAGTVVLAGVPDPQVNLRIPFNDFVSRGGSLKSPWYGDCVPERDFPILINLYRQGRLPLEKFVSERICLADVDAALHKTQDGDVGRYVVML
jgi:S-(hydroxymethyl)mycothiol dehydrogenase